MKIQLKDNKLYLDESIYENGDVIFGSIQKLPTMGKLRIVGDYMFFCQNTNKGASPVDRDLLGFDKSWQFTVSGGSLTADVTLTNYKADKNFNLDEPIRFVNESKGFVRFATFQNGKILKDSEILFTITPIADCCGATLLHAFKSGYAGDHYEKINEKDFKLLEDFICNSMTSNKIAYLQALGEKKAIKLLTKLNFRIVDSFINKNTMNKIEILSRKDEIIK